MARAVVTADREQASTLHLQSKTRTIMNTYTPYEANQPQWERVVLCGDSHANTGFIKSAIQAAAETGAQAVVQVGDFGWWPSYADGRRFIDKVSRAAVKEGIPVIFCDGNHEDHSSLPHDAEGPVEMAEGLVYVPRGRVMTLGGRRFMFFGGAVSVDQALRTPGRDWFHTEVANNAQISRAMAAGSVDVVVAHDMPEGVTFTSQLAVTETIQRACDQHRAMLAMVAEAVTPQLWVAGHYHQRISSEVGSMRVEVLDCEWPQESSVAVCDLDTLALRSVAAARTA